MCYMCVHHVTICLSSLVIFWGGCHRVYGNIALRIYRSLYASAYQMFFLSCSPGFSEPQSIIFPLLASHLAKVSLGLQKFDSLRGKWLLGGPMRVILPNTLLQKVNHCWPFQLFEEFTWLQNFHLLFWAEMQRKFGWWCLHWLWGGVKGNHLSSNFS